MIDLDADVAYWSRRLDSAVERFKDVRPLGPRDESYQEADALVAYCSAKIRDARRILVVREIGAPEFSG